MRLAEIVGSSRSPMDLAFSDAVMAYLRRFLALGIAALVTLIPVVIVACLFLIGNEVLNVSWFLAMIFVLWRITRKRRQAEKESVRTVKLPREARIAVVAILTYTAIATAAGTTLGVGAHFMDIVYTHGSSRYAYEAEESPPAECRRATWDPVNSYDSYDVIGSTELDYPRLQSSYQKPPSVPPKKRAYGVEKYLSPQGFIYYKLIFGDELPTGSMPAEGTERSPGDSGP